MSSWKLLISSTTNVAVDRVLQVWFQTNIFHHSIHFWIIFKCLMGLEFEDFVRVGSVKKIAKPILPFSTSAAGADKQVHTK